MTNAPSAPISPWYSLAYFDETRTTSPPVSGLLSRKTCPFTGCAGGLASPYSFLQPDKASVARPAATKIPKKQDLAARGGVTFALSFHIIDCTHLINQDRQT